MATVEVLIIGGGVIGSSIAYHAARLGRTVLVAERKGVAVEPAASWASKWSRGVSVLLPVMPIRDAPRALLPPPRNGMEPSTGQAASASPCTGSVTALWER
jgi:choline dehydrogenase-like flavoprotein